MNRHFALCSLLFAICPLTSAFSLPLFRDSLPNGLIVLTYEDHRLPIADISLLCRSGHDCDPLEKAGLARLTAQLLPRGTRTISGDSVASIVEFLGGRFEGWADDDHSELNLRVLSKDLATALDLLADAVLNPAFDPREFSRTRDMALAQARRAYDRPQSLAMLELNRLLFIGHPFATSATGDTATIPKITRDDLIAFHKTHFVPNNCFMVIVGDVDRQKVLAELGSRFQNWQPSSVPKPVLPELTFPDRLRCRYIHRPELNQTYIALGHPGIRVTDPDMLSTRLMSYILGGSAMSSRLGLAVREEAGLAYDVRCWFDRGRHQGLFRATVQTADPKSALGKMFQEIRLMHDSGATRTEL
ncbi:MAG: pitrilysin family protein, partial [candidate division WOR-3 bacterium]